MYIVIRIFVALVLIAVSLPFFSYASSNEEKGSMDLMMNVQKWESREGLIDLPDYPKRENLIPVDIDTPDARFKYFIDPESIWVGDDKLTSRLTMVIESRTGFQNIFVEHYRCDSREYKTLAYGTGDKTFYRHHDPVWENISQYSGTGLDYRRDLITVYLCDENSSVLQKSEVLQRIRFPGDIEDSGGF